MDVANIFFSTEITPTRASTFALNHIFKRSAARPLFAWRKQFRCVRMRVLHLYTSIDGIAQEAGSWQECPS